MNNKIPLLCIVGPTASGKTGLSVELAERYNGEIVSCDSMQIYKGMDIATAKVTKEEARGIAHHLVDFLPIGEAFSVSDYVKLAHKVIAEIYERGKLPILVGGTGLYYSSLVGNITFSEEKIDEKLRAELNEQYQREGGEILLKQLAEFDPETASTLHPNNGKRIIRAIEIYRNTGITMSEQMKRSKEKPSPYNYLTICLTYKDRQKLYDRINLRVDKMLGAGILDEAKAFFNQNPGKTASAAIGIKEFKPYFDGECSLEDAVEKLKMETRRYAKRQLTWFRRCEDVKFLECDCFDILSESERLIHEWNFLKYS